MANLYPSNAHKKVKEEGKKIYNVKIKQFGTDKVVYESKSLTAASRFLGSYDLYLFHTMKGYRKHRLNPLYDTYIDDIKLEPTSGYFDKNIIVKMGITTYFGDNHKNKLEILDIKHDQENDYYELIVKINNMKPMYLFFSGLKPPTYNNIVKKIRDKLGAL